MVQAVSKFGAYRAGRPLTRSVSERPLSRNAGSSKLVDCALSFLQSGIISIPLCPNSKHIAFHAMQLPPYHAVTARKQLKDIAYQSLAFNLALRPPSEADLCEWFSNHLGNIGIVTGYKNLIVLDFDERQAFQRWADAYPTLAQSTPVERTPNGFHVYLRCAEPLATSSLYFKTKKAGHLKAFGGYVACSPSRVRESPGYAWLANRSPLEVPPALIPNLAAISSYPTGWLRRHHDRFFRRGFFKPDEAMATHGFSEERVRLVGFNAPETKRETCRVQS